MDENINNNKNSKNYILRKSNILIQLFIILIAISFTISFFYLTLEIHNILNDILMPLFPGGHTPSLPGSESFESARIIGLICLIFIILIIILGFLIKKLSLSSIGNFILFLPIFGHFLFQMLLLVGIQAFQAILIPLDQINTNYQIDILSLGSILKLPAVFVYNGTNISNPCTVMNNISYIFIIIGLFIFSIGVVNWFQGTIKKKRIFTYSIYKYSRHPQYLGYLIWSYGIYLLTLNATINYFPGCYYFDYTFMWLIQALIIIGICLYEEVIMNEKYQKKNEIYAEDYLKYPEKYEKYTEEYIKSPGKFPESYAAYRRKTSFLIPLPKYIKLLFLEPSRIFCKKEFPENRRKVFFIVLFWGMVIIVISFFFKSCLIIDYP